MPLPVFQPYMPGINDSPEKKIKNLTNAYIETMEQLQWLLAHLNQDNISSFNTVDGTNLFNRYGINPEKELWSPNMWCNSDMCVYDSDSLPRFVSGTGVEVSDNAVYVGQKSMMVPVGITAAYTPEAAVTASTINPAWLSAISSNMYLAFHAKFTGGTDDTVKVEIYNQTAGANLTIYDAYGNSGTYLNFTRGDWDDDIVYVWFTPGVSTDIRPKITNSSATLALYCNGMQVCADINKKYPQPYIRGKFSVGDKNGSSVELKYLQSIYVQDAEPTDAVEKDVHIDTNDYSRYDRQAFATTGSDTVADEEVVEFTGVSAISYTLSSTGATAGCVKLLKNSSTAIVTVVATVDGVANMYLYPGESCKLIWNGTDWRMW